MATSVDEGNSANESSRLCDACTRDNESTPATTWCKDCKDILCDACTIVHRRIRSCVKHLTIPLHDMSERDIAISRLEIDTNCPLHHGNPLSMYCKLHEILCCVVCACTSHDDCKALIPIDDIGEKCTEKKTMAFKKSQYSKIGNIVQKSIDEKKLFLANLEEDTSSISSEVEGLVKKLEETLQQSLFLLRTKLQENYTAARKSQENKLKALVEFKASVEKCARVTGTLCYVSPKDAMIKTDHMQQETAEQCNKLKGILQKDPDVRLRLRYDVGLKGIPKTLSCIGYIEKDTQPMENNKEVTLVEGIIETLHIKQGFSTQAQAIIKDTRLQEDECYAEPEPSTCTRPDTEKVDNSMSIEDVLDDSDWKYQTTKMRKNKQQKVKQNFKK